MLGLIATSACARERWVNLDFPSDDRAGTEILYVEQGEFQEAFVIPLEDGFANLPAELDGGEPIRLEAMLYAESPQLLGLRDAIAPRSDERRRVLPRTTHTRVIDGDSAGEWTDAAEPSETAMKFLPPLRCRKLVNDYTHEIFEPDVLEIYAIDAETALVITSSVGVPTFYRARLNETPLALSTDPRGFEVGAAIRGIDTTWMTGTVDGVRTTATLDGDGAIHFVEVQGETPPIILLAAAAKTDRFAVYGRTSRATFGFDGGARSWILLAENVPGASATPVFEFLERLDDGVLLAGNNSGLYRAGNTVVEEAPWSVTGLNYLPDIGYLASNASLILRRDPQLEEWVEFGAVRARFPYPRWIGPYPGGILSVQYPGQVQQTILGDGDRCLDQIITVHPYGLARKIVRLEYGWITAGPTGTVKPKSFIATFYEED